MMQTILIAHNSSRDAVRLSELIEDAGLNAELCSSGADLARHLEKKNQSWAAIIIFWNCPARRLVPNSWPVVDGYSRAFPWLS